mmetsp:Transcript_42593/g.49764  ORF Transcript_42593/g.49764 Transcript_42593/m.49764 type:complete len:81 (-) Transcript_42593:216-458(-)
MDLIRKSQKKDKSTSDLNQGRAVYDVLFNPKNIISGCERSGFNITYNLHKSFYNQLDFTKITDESFFDFIRNCACLSDIT